MKAWILAVLMGTWSSCSYELPEPAPPVPFDPGTADFQRLTLLGGSQSAGLMDGALHTIGQHNAIGSLISRQINLNNVNPIVFQQPDIGSENGYNPLGDLLDEQGKLFLKFISPGSDRLFRGANPGEIPADYQGPALNNFSVPYMRTTQVADPQLSQNLFYQRFAADPGTSSVLEEVIASDPSLLILQLGWDDIIPYAFNGLTGSTDADPDQLGEADLTPLDAFSDALQNILDRVLTETDAEILIMNVPDIGGFPFFNSIACFADIAGAEVAQVQNFYIDYNLNASRYSPPDNRRPLIKFFPDDPPHLWKVVVEDSTLAEVVLPDGSLLPKYRQLLDGEFVLWSSPEIPNAKDPGVGTYLPLPKKFYFDLEDAFRVMEIVNDFNTVIFSQTFNRERIHRIDCNQRFRQWFIEGVDFNGVAFTYDFTRTGIFSADGITLNQRGSALLSNFLIEEINDIYGSNIPAVDVNAFAGNVFVNDF